MHCCASGKKKKSKEACAMRHHFYPLSLIANARLSPKRGQRPKVVVL
jgi:hypothetical protein